MNWVYIVWSSVAGICTALAGFQLLMWMRSRDMWVYLLFSVAALAGAVLALLELALMQAQSPTQFNELWHWYHVVLFVFLIALVWFVRFYLQAGNLWLAWLFTGMRTLVLILTFSLEPNLNFIEITDMRAIEFLGEAIMVPVGEKNPWTNITNVSVILLLIFVLQASFSAWRAGNRRHATTISITFGTAIIIGFALSEMLNKGILPVPFTLCLPFTIILVGIAYELSAELTRVKQLAEELRHAERRLRLSTSSADIGVWDWDIERDEVWVTDSTRQLLGLGENEILRFSTILEKVHPDDRDAIRLLVDNASNSYEEFALEYRIIAVNNETHWLRAQGRVECGSTGNPLHMRGVSIDITAQKEAELLNWEAAEFNKKVLASLHSQIAILNQSGTILAVNKAWNLFDDRAPSNVGVNYLEVCERAVVDEHDTTAQRVKAGIMSVLEGAIDYFEIEYPCSSPVGTRSFLMRVVPLQTTAGGAVVSHTEITKIKEAELESAELRRDLAHVQRVSTLGQLSTALAHEINQPLGAILRNAEAAELFLGQNPPDLDEVRSILADIRKDDERASSVIERMRSLLKHRELMFETLALGALIEEVVQLLHIEIQEHRTNVLIDLPRTLPRVRGDRVHLQQVILNLLINSLDALQESMVEQRQIIVRVSPAREGMVEVAVIDHGTGFTPEQKLNIFNPFFTTKTKGTGIGLAVTKAIVELHGGKITAENNPEDGATIRFTLKAEQERAQE